MTAQTDDPWPHPSRAIAGSRRLMGANLYSAFPGAVLEVVVEADGDASRIERWRSIVRSLLARIGWQDHTVVIRQSTGTFAGLFLSAPIDGLLAATEVNEQAWLAAEQQDDAYDLDDIAARLRVFIQHDRRPLLTDLACRAHDHGVSVAFDDDYVTVGAGVGSRTWPLDRLPASDDVPWAAVHDVPVVLVTGSNGKTTTVRLLAAMMRAHDVTLGWCCTNGVFVGDACIASGDYSGPAGARTVLQDTRVAAAVLETARGGILRRGLAVERANVAIVTNISDDHLGEYGINSLRALGEAKMVVARVVQPDGRLVLNADDATLRELAPLSSSPALLWFSLHESPFIRAHVASGGDACVLNDGRLVAFVAGARVDLGDATELPLTLHGRMQYNVSNALAAAAAALSLGVPPATVRRVLAEFGTRIEDNPGRLATFSFQGARILLDFVHNPDGWRSLAAGLDGVPGRRIAVVGQAGDRDNRALHELAIAVGKFAPDHVILKEMPSYLRGRELGEVSEILWREFRTLGLAELQISKAPDELTAITAALNNVLPDDLIVVGVHEDFDAAVDAVRAAGAVDARWG